MDRLLAILCFVTAIGIMVVAFPDGMAAVLVAVLLSFITIFLLRKEESDSAFLIRIFLIALLARIALGTFTYVLQTEFFGSDPTSYDAFGARLVDLWFGRADKDDPISQIASAIGGPGWGMNYLTAFVYLIVGRNMLAAQFLCAVIGAATAPLVYICSYEIFSNKRVSQYSAILVALFPAFIVWSSQLLKDGLIIFLLVLIMTLVLRMQKKFSFDKVAVLAAGLIGILTLRFYIFYLVTAAVAGSFIIGTESSIKSIVRGFIAMVLVGMVLVYLGALQTASSDIERYASLERIQASRADLANRANSGYGETIDVSTPVGALQALPMGFTYLMFAPFPWEISNVRQAVTLPEMLIWWGSVPLLIIGLWFTIKNKLRSSIAILMFTVLLTLAYSVFQGNVGTAYRQRAQIQVFLFIFIAVGLTLIIERRENKAVVQNNKHKEYLKFIRRSEIEPPAGSPTENGAAEYGAAEYGAAENGAAENEIVANEVRESPDEKENTKT